MTLVALELHSARGWEVASGCSTLSLRAMTGEWPLRRIMRQYQKPTVSADFFPLKPFTIQMIEGFFRNIFVLQAGEFWFGLKRVRRRRAGRSAEKSLSEE